MAIQCDFCTDKNSVVKGAGVIVVGRAHVAICEECIRIAGEIVVEQKMKQTKDSK